jgi:ABC-type dipeptide/oligopeptide/nickel transport system permease component
MSSYVVRRLLLSALVVWGAVSVIFVIVRIVPGDPASMMLGPSATPAQVSALRERLGLSRPLAEQYLEYLDGVAHLDFGDSLREHVPASRAVAERVPSTAELGLATLLLALVVSFPLGIMAARAHGTAADHSIRILSLAAQSLPTFWIGLMLLLVFARTLRLLPSIGNASPSNLILPSITLALPLVGTISLLVRNGLLDIFHDPYIQTARSKGLNERVVILRHAVPNMLIPVVTVVGLMLGDLLGGLVLVELVFAWPGLGRLTVDAIHDRDYPIVQACVAFIAIAYAVINLVVDVLYARLDPRIRIAKSA